MTQSVGVPEVVEKLTKAQRAMLVGAHEGAIEHAWFVFMRNGATTKIISNLRDKGLTEPHRINIQRLTPLGLAVRAYLANAHQDTHP